MTRRPPVVVAVVSWNTRDLLENCLESLRPIARDGTADVWVVDNASSDASAEMVSRRFPWARLIALDTNAGFGRAANLVACNTRHDFLAIANADTQVMPGAVESLLSAADIHPTTGAFAPQLVLPDGSTQHSVYPFPTIPFTVAYASGAIARVDWLARWWCIDRGFDPNHGRKVAWAVGAFLLIRRTAWNAVGGFDETQWMYAEDLDLGWRLRRSGWGIRYVPEAKVLHAEAASTSQAWGEERFARWHASTYAWMARRRGFVVTRTVAAINVIAFLTKGVARLPLALAGDERAKNSCQMAFRTARLHSVGLRERALLAKVK